jgi:hypothetical protein
MSLNAAQKFLVQSIAQGIFAAQQLLESQSGDAATALLNNADEYLADLDTDGTQDGTALVKILLAVDSDAFNLIDLVTAITDDRELSDDEAAKLIATLKDSRFADQLGAMAAPVDQQQRIKKSMAIALGLPQSEQPAFLNSTGQVKLVDEDGDELPDLTIVEDDEMVSELSSGRWGVLVPGATAPIRVGTVSHGATRIQ